MSNERIYEYDLIWKGNADVNNAVTTAYVYSYSNTNNRIVLANIQNTSNVEFDPERFEVPRDKFDTANTVYSLDSETNFTFTGFDDLFVYLRRYEECPDCGPGSVITQNVPEQYVTMTIPNEDYRLTRVCGTCGCVGTSCNCDDPDVVIPETVTYNVKVSDAYTITATVQEQSCEPPYLKVENSSGKFLPEYPILCNGKELGIVGSITEISKSPYIKNYIISRPGEFLSDNTDPCTVVSEPYINYGSYIGPHVAQEEYFTGKRTQDYKDDYIIVSTWDITGNNVPIGHVLDLYDNVDNSYTSISMNVSAPPTAFIGNVTNVISNTVTFSGMTITNAPQAYILGADNMDEISVPANVDDGFAEIELPFPILFEGVEYSKIFLGTNGYITFGAGSTEILEEYDPTLISLPKIYIETHRDLYLYNLYTKTEGVSPNRIFTIRYEGTSYDERNTFENYLEFEVAFFESYDYGGEEGIKSPVGYYEIYFDTRDSNEFPEPAKVSTSSPVAEYASLESSAALPIGFLILENYDTGVVIDQNFDYVLSGDGNSKILNINTTRNVDFTVNVLGNVSINANSTDEIISLRNDCQDVFIAKTNTTTISNDTYFNKSLFTKGYEEAIDVIRTSNSNVVLDLTNSHVFHIKSTTKQINNMSIITSTDANSLRPVLIVFSDIDRINNNIWYTLNVAWSNGYSENFLYYSYVNTRPSISSSNTAVLSLLKNPVENGWFGFWQLYQVQT